MYAPWSFAPSGAQLYIPCFPPLTRWATTFRPCRGWCQEAQAEASPTRPTLRAKVANLLEKPCTSMQDDDARSLLAQILEDARPERGPNIRRPKVTGTKSAIPSNFSHLTLAGNSDRHPAIPTSRFRKPTAYFHIR